MMNQVSGCEDSFLKATHFTSVYLTSGLAQSTRGNVNRSTRRPVSRRILNAGILRSWLCLAALLLSITIIHAQTSETNTQSQPLQLAIRNHIERNLAIGDFAAINELYADASIALPDTSVSVSDLDLDLSNIVCRNITIGDVTLDWEQRSGRGVFMTLQVIGLDLICDIDYGYSYILGLNGDGHATVTASNTSVAATIAVTTPSAYNFAKGPPTNITMINCQPNIQISDMDFGGGVVSFVLDVVEKPLRGVVEDQLGSFLCDALTKLEGGLEKLLSKVNGLLEPFVNVTKSDTDPLALEQSLDIPNNVSVLDFKHPNTTLGAAVNALISKATDYLSSTSSSGDLVINGILQDTVLDDSGAYAVSLSDLSGLGDGILWEDSNEFGVFQVQMQEIRILGLDSFSQFGPFEQTGSYTIEGSLALDALSVSMGLTIEVRPPMNSTGYDGHVLTETATLGIKFDPVSASVGVLLAINEGKLNGLRIGSLLDTDNALQCVLSTVWALQVAELSVDNLRFQQPTLDGLKSPGIKRVASAAFDSIFTMYNSTLSQALPGFIQSKASKLLNDALRSLTNDGSCTRPEVGPDNEYIDFRDLLLSADEAKAFGASGTEPYGTLGSILKNFVNDQLLSTDPDTGLSTVNSLLIDPITKSQSGEAGTLMLANNLVRIDTRVDAFDARIELQLSNARIEHVNTLGAPLSVLSPVNGEPYILNNTATLGSSPSPPMTATANILLAITTDDKAIRNEIDLSVSLRSVNLLLAALLKVQKNAFFQFPLDDLLDLDCWMATIPAPNMDEYGFRTTGIDPTLSVTDLAVAISDLNFTLDCHNCTGPKFQELASLLQSPEGHDDARSSADRVINLALSLLEGDDSFLQTQLDRRLVDAAKRCRHSPSYDPNATAITYAPLVIDSSSGTDDATDVIFVMLAVVAGIVLASWVIIVVVRLIVSRRHRQWLASLPDEQVAAIYRQQEADDKADAELNARTVSMFTSPDVPALVRYSMPLIVVGNIGLFLTGHLSLGGTVQILISLGGEVVKVKDFYSFSIAQSAIELWNAGGKPLAILILLFSGIWPYTKQLIVLVLWFISPRVVSVARRGSIFLWLDVLAKWSMVDVFVTIVSIVAFRVTIESPRLSFLPTDLWRVDLLVVPVWGLYANMLAQIVSQLSSHVVIFYHRRVVTAASAELVRSTDGSLKREETYESDENGDSQDRAVPSVAASLDVKEPVCDHEFVRPHRGEANKLRVRRGVSMGLYGVSLLAIVLVVVGCSLWSFSFDIQGLVGLAVEAGQDFKPAVETYNIFSIANLLMDEARLLGTAKDKLGMASISSLLVLSTLIVPIFQVLVLLVQWRVPLSRSVRQKMMTTVEILQAWQYMEVYVLSIVLGVWQLGDVSEYLLNDYCDGLKGTFSQLVYYGLIKPEDAQCFRTQAGIENGTFVLIAAAVVLTIVTVFVNKAVFQFNRDKALQERNADNKNGMIAANESMSIDSPSVDVSKRFPIQSIRPVPVLFTDRFRWLLVAESPVPTDQGEESLSP